MRSLIPITTLLLSLAIPAFAQDERTHEEPDEQFEGDQASALTSLRTAELALFAQGRSPIDFAALSEELLQGVPSALTSAVEMPNTIASGAPLPWLANLTMPDMPIQWREPIVRYLDYFQNDRRGHRLMNGWLRRSTRYGAMIQGALQSAGLPEDLRCVAMAESGFDPTVRSNRGAAGMWQFVQRTGAEYGLSVDRFVDQRMDPIASTRAAAEFLGELYRRTGRWELALAAYNMGYPALLRAIRKYNTNNYWTLAGIEAGLPFETTVYVSKIMACAVVMRNPEHFGFVQNESDAPMHVESVQIGGGMTLGRLARAAGVSRDVMVTLNPHLRRGRTPPGRGRTTIHVPAAQASHFRAAWARIQRQDPMQQTIVVRFGERLRDLAYRHRTSISTLRTQNGLSSSEDLSAGMTLLVPAGEAREAVEETPVAAMPPARFHYEDRRRVFFRVIPSTTLAQIAQFFELSESDIARWNGLDPEARLHRGMVLQLFVAREMDLTGAWVLGDGDVREVTVGSERFFNDHEENQGRVRFVHTVLEGETLRSLAQRFGLSRGSLARINRFSRRSDLEPGQEVIIYADIARAPARFRNLARGQNEASAETGTEAVTHGAPDPTIVQDGVADPAEDAQANP